MKRPILGLLAAVILSIGLLGPSPARAATSNSPTTAAVTLGDDDDDDDFGDDEHDNGNNGHCTGPGLIVLCIG